MAGFSFGLLIGIIMPFVIELSICRHVTCRCSCNVMIRGKSVFIFCTKSMMLTQQIVEAALNTIVTTDSIRQHIIALLP